MCGKQVGTGSEGKKSVLARCCIVDFHGTKIYDKFVRPKGEDNQRKVFCVWF